ncbi:MAG TPA: S41 family peptidase, partial [Ktedonobacteraceae bacterium]|nr:S41 family peptidase [Ktedonobacteraceae bacterium]
MDNQLDHETRAQVIADLMQKLHEHYVFPEIGERMVNYLKKRLVNKAYDEVSDPQELAQLLTTHLQEVRKDSHLSVVYQDQEDFYTEEQGEEAGIGRDIVEDARAFGQGFNFGFEKVERLPGNVGYLVLRAFFPPALAGDVAIGAMHFLANSSALIVDLRKAGGGEPSMAAFLCSYFFPPEPRHLNSLYWRANHRIQQFWTLSYLPCPRYLDKPVYVLTSSSTPSAAEEFAYNLQSFKRAIIVGEITSGGANPHKLFDLSNQFGCWIP